MEDVVIGNLGPQMARVGHINAAKWVEDNVSIRPEVHAGTLELNAAVVLPVSPLMFYELITHPDNCEIFEGVTRCVHRKIVANDGRGAQLIEVENESNWHVLFIKGRVRTRLVVAQDMQAGVMHFTLAPGSPSVMKELYGRWTIHEMPGDQQQVGSDGTPQCLVTLHQRVAPKNVPPFLFSAFAKFAIKQVVRTFEDIVEEIHRIRHGEGSLPPYMAACMKEISSPDADATATATTATDPHSVLTALEEASNASTSSESGATAPPSMDFLLAQLGPKSAGREVDGTESQRSGGTSAASMASSSLMEPLSHALHRWDIHEDDEVEVHPVELAETLESAPLSGWESAVAAALHAWTTASRWAEERLPVIEESEEFEEDMEEEAALDRTWLVIA